MWLGVEFSFDFPLASVLVTVQFSQRECSDKLTMKGGNHRFHSLLLLEWMERKVFENDTLSSSWDEMCSNWLTRGVFRGGSKIEGQFKLSAVGSANCLWGIEYSSNISVIFETPAITELTESLIELFTGSFTIISDPKGGLWVLNLDSPIFNFSSSILQCWFCAL